MNRQADEIAGSSLDVETCQRHLTEYPAWLTCPRCSEDRESIAFANHYARRRQDGAEMPLFKAEEREGEIRTLLDTAHRLERHAPWMFVFVLVFFLVTGGLMCGNNRDMDAERQVSQGENGR